MCLISWPLFLLLDELLIQTTSHSPLAAEDYQNIKAKVDNPGELVRELAIFERGTPLKVPDPSCNIKSDFHYVTAVL